MNFQCRLCPTMFCNHDDDLLCDHCSLLNRLELFDRILQLLKAKANDFEGLNELCQSVSPLFDRYEFHFHICQYFNYFQHRQDRLANQYLNSYCEQKYQDYVALELSENCNRHFFYECIMAIFEYADPNLIIELRVRNYVELILNYLKYPTDLLATQILPDFIADALLDKGQMVSIWDFRGMASVLYVRIRSIYPFINGIRDEMANKFNTVFKSRNADYTNENDIVILWTNNLKLNECQSPWRPNTLVPLLRKHKSSIESFTSTPTSTRSETCLVEENVAEERGVFYIATPCQCRLTKRQLDTVVSKECRQARDCARYEKRAPEKLEFICPICLYPTCDGYVYDQEAIIQFRRNYHNSLYTCILLDISSSMNRSYAFGMLKYLTGTSKLTIAIHAIEKLIKQIALNAVHRQQEKDKFEMYLFNEKLLKDPPFIPKCDAITADSFSNRKKLSNIKCSHSSIGTAIFDALDQIFDHIDRQSTSSCDLFCFTDGSDTSSLKSVKQRLQHIQFRRHETNLCFYHIETSNDGKKENVLEADKHIILKNSFAEIQQQIETLHYEPQYSQEEFNTEDQLRTRFRPMNNYDSTTITISSTDDNAVDNNINRSSESIQGQKKQEKSVNQPVQVNHYMLTRNPMLKKWN